MSLDEVQPDIRQNYRSPKSRCDAAPLGWLVTAKRPNSPLQEVVGYGDIGWSKLKNKLLSLTVRQVSYRHHYFGGKQFTDARDLLKLLLYRQSQVTRHVL
jgi:hypothetical protein